MFRGNRFALVSALAVALAQTAIAGVVEEGVKDAKPSGLLAGAAKVSIDPAVGIPHQNWGSATHIVAKAIDPEGMFVRALVLSDGPIDLPFLGTVMNVRAAAPPSDTELSELSIKKATRELEADLIKRALGVTQGNRTNAAKLLEISHRALLYKMKEYGIS